MLLYAKSSSSGCDKKNKLSNSSQAFVLGSIHGLQLQGAFCSQFNDLKGPKNRKCQYDELEARLWANMTCQYEVYI